MTIFGSCINAGFSFILQEFFDNLCEFMSSGPSVVLVLTKGATGEGIIDEWRDMLGPANVEEAKENAPDRLDRETIIMV